MTSDIVKRLVFVVLFFSVVSSYAQSEFRIGAYVERVSTFRVFNDNGKDLENYQHPVWVWSAGVTLEKVITNKLYIATGVGYGRMGYDMDPYFYYNSFHIFRDYVKIPLLVNYELLHAKKFAAGGGAGLNNNFLFKVSTRPFNYLVIPYYVDPTGRIGQRSEVTGFSDLKDAGYHIYNIALTGNVFVAYQFSSRIGLRFTPTFEYNLTTTAGAEADFNEHLYSFGYRLFVMAKL